MNNRRNKVMDNRDNFGVKYSNYIDVIINNNKEWSNRISNPQWGMYEWWMKQVKKAEEIYRRAIVENNGAIV
jgi:hypothetical protein